MPANRPPKRRKGPTPRKRPAGPEVHPAGVDRHPPGSVRPDATARIEPSSRYTPKRQARGPFRPTWHKAIGALLLLAGVAIFIINDLAWFDINWIPGGHNELYAMLAFAVAGTSTWWFGWFDRPPGKTW